MTGTTVKERRATRYKPTCFKSTLVALKQSFAYAQYAEFVTELQVFYIKMKASSPPPHPHSLPTTPPFKILYNRQANYH